MEQNLVSVVVPIYNVEPYIEQCIETIREQSYKNLEIILVDDGSKDNSGKIAETYAQKDTRIKVIHKENGGLSDARNAGMKIATGDYICFIDSDDYIEKNMIEKVVESINKTKVDIAVWGFYVEYEDKNGKMLKRCKNTLRENIINVKKDIKKISIDMNFLKVLGYAWNKMYNLKFLREHNFFFEKGLSGIEDSEFNSRVFQKVDTFMLIDSAYNHYMQRPRETLGNKKYDNLLELNIRLCECHRSLLENWRVSSEKIKEIQALDYFLILKIQIKNIILNNNSKREKKIEIENILEIEEIRMALDNQQIQTGKDRIYSFLVKKYCIVLLKIYYKLIKKYFKFAI